MIELYQVDAFTDKPFAGNPAAVCLLKEAAADDWMRIVAQEMNLSETAFLVPQADGYGLRWFTPAVEVDLCGHATLASAHVLWEAGYLAADEEARFYTRSGLLTAVLSQNWITLNFPAKPETPAETPPGLAEALGVEPVYVGRNAFDYIVELESETAVRQLTPDFAALRTLGVRGVMVTARAETEGLDFVSRFFAPGSGIDEDPVTGSAHCCLGPYWAGKMGKSSFTAYQASPRGGLIRVSLQGDRVLLQGQAVTILRGQLMR
jgi:PhzF family phenazine biosynthesis protein